MWHWWPIRLDFVVERGGSILSATRSQDEMGKAKFSPTTLPLSCLGTFIPRELCTITSSRELQHWVKTLQVSSHKLYAQSHSFYFTFQTDSEQTHKSESSLAELHFFSCVLFATDPQMAKSRSLVKAPESRDAQGPPHVQKIHSAVTIVSGGFASCIKWSVLDLCQDRFLTLESKY